MITIRIGSTLFLAALAGCASTQNDVASTSTQTSTTQSKSTAGGAPEMQLPPGWSEADMQACAAAGTPGAQHKQLARGAGHWSGTHTMWMAPGMEPSKSPVTSECTPMMDGRYMQLDFKGDMPGMGPFHGMGYSGFDNVSQKYWSFWFDNCGTGFMSGDGTPSADGKTMTWNYRYNCPINKKQTTMREVQRFTGEDSMTLDMYGPEPHTGKEYQMMHIELTRSSP